MTVASNENQSHAQLLRHGDAQLGHARRLPRLPAQLPRAPGRRPLPRRRRLGPGDAHHQLRPGRGQPHDAGRRRPGRRVVARRAACASTSPSTAAAASSTRPTTRRRPIRWPTPFADPATRGAFGYINHTYDHPNLDCSTSSVHRQARSPTTSTWAPPARPPDRRRRGRHRRALRPGQHAARQPRHDRPADASTTSTPAAGGTIPAGTYDYALTAQSAGRRDDRLRRARHRRRRRPEGDRELQRRLPRGRLQPLPQRRGRQRWTQVGTLARSATAATDDGTNPIALTHHRRGRRRHRRGAAGRQRRRARALRAEPELPAAA